MRKINKTELIIHMMTVENMDQPTVTKFLNDLGKYIQNEVAIGNQIKIQKFGTFASNKRQKQIGHNPSTGQPMVHPAHYVPTFKPSQQFRDLTRNNNKNH